MSGFLRSPTDATTPMGAARATSRWLPPVRRWEFWAVQGLVLLIAVGHVLIETIDNSSEPTGLYLLPTSLYFVPVVYAALNFGLRGSVSTALWSAALTLPNVLLWHTGGQQIGELWQMTIVVALAVFVGQRVDRERGARTEAERREHELRLSEERYRGLFDNAAEAVLLLDQWGRILEANDAAALLLGRARAELRGTALSEVAGPAVAEALRAEGRRGAVELPSRPEAPATWVEPIVCTPHRRPERGHYLQLMLHDVTLQQQHQRDLEAYTRQVLVAREQEQRRIGRELHDGPLQSLVAVRRGLADFAREGTLDSSEGLDDVLHEADATYDELRRICRAMRPSVLDDLGLAAALKSEATALARRTGIAAHVEEHGEPRSISSEAELLLLRVGQEMIHNVERHAAATKLTLRLEFRQADVRIVVRDNGRGIADVPSAAELLGKGKLGLVGMQERVRLAGGQFKMRDAPGGGAAFEVVVPA